MGSANWKITNYANLILDSLLIRLLDTCIGRRYTRTLFCIKFYGFIVGITSSEIWVLSAYFSLAHKL